MGDGYGYNENTCFFDRRKRCASIRFWILMVFIYLSGVIFASDVSGQNMEEKNVLPPMLQEQVTLTVRNLDSTRGVMHYAGRILRYDRTGVEILTSERNRIILMPEQIMRVDYQRSIPQRNAEEMYIQKNYKTAVMLFKEAREQERRPLVRAWLTEKIIRCYRNLEQPAEAVMEFLKLQESQPEMTDEMFSCIPLLWEPNIRDTVTAGKVANIYREQRTGITQLLYGSYMLSSAERQKAIQVLKAVSRGKDIRLATLAEAQLWRVTEPGELSEKITEWTKVLERIPVCMRGGPTFIMGRAWLQMDNKDMAVLEFLKVGTVYHQVDPFSADSFINAARILEREGQKEEARTVYRDILLKFPDTRAVLEAEKWLAENP
ncbi:MAG: hypothetical protein Q4C96_09975 [Planctomycetia bacterium]|nr:hypothetical protein [Planctomycetia bacterium]